jgi:hypothetical protein
MNTDTTFGIHVKRLFQEQSGNTIVHSYVRGGGRRDHFDFCVRLDDGRELQVEAKGTKRQCVVAKQPWHLGVQLYNGTGSTFSLGHKYSRAWYHAFIESSYVSMKYGIMTPIPSYDDWSKDVFSQSKGKSEWTKEIRQKVPNGFSSERNSFVKEFNETISEHDMRLLSNEVMEIARHVLGEKHYWIQIHRDLDSELRDVVWTPQVSIPTGTPRVDIIKSTDTLLQLTWEDGRSLKTILRWGYGKGISNLRMDIK